nr:hypothetical protein [Tanacetum cinerariifolium]
MKRVNTFVDYKTELIEESSKKAEAEVMEGSSKRAGTELEQESSKKQKIDDDKEIAELKQLVKIIPDEEGVAIDAIPLVVKPQSIVDWKIHKEGKKSYYQIIRADGSSKIYLVFSHMFKSFDREDMETLWKLVKDKHGSIRPEEGYKRVLWSGLKKNELLRAELEKSSSDSKDIQANLLKQIKILENDFKRSQAQSIDFELKLQHQKEKIACDVSWKSKLSTINDENVLLETQVDYVVKVRENIKLEYKKLFKSIKVTRTQHKKELDELIEHVNQKTYAYADVHAQNQDLSITISELKNKLQTVDMGKTVNTKFDKFEASRTLLYVTPLPKHIWLRLRKCQILRNSSVKRALFTTLIAGKSKNLGATSIVSKSRLSVAKTAIATNKVSSVLPLSSDSSQSRTLSNYMKNKIATSRKWQKWFKTQQCFNWTPKSKTAQSLPSETKSQIRVRSTSNTLVTTQKWVAKMSTLSSMFVSYDAGDPARPLGC